MKYYWRIFLWQNGAKSTEYTDYANAPIFVEDKLDETLDTGEVILYAMPIATKTAFPPKTKFRLERYTTENYTDTPRTWDMVVEHDDVQEYEGCAEICTHRIHLIEASAIAQGMHCDNIALTYELQDVTLDYKTIQSRTDTLLDTGMLRVGDNGNFSPEHSNPTITPPTSGQSQYFYFVNSYYYRWKNYDALKSIKYQQDGRQSYNISFTIPTLMAQGCFTTGTWTDICELSTRVRLYERLYNGSGTLVSERLIVDRVCGATSLGSATTNEVYNKRTPSYIGGAPENPPLQCFPTHILNYDNNDDGLLRKIHKQFSDLYVTGQGGVITEENSAASGKSVSFNTAVLTESQMKQGYYYQYDLECDKNTSIGTNNLETRYSRPCLVLDNSYGLHQNMINPTTATIDASTLYVRASFQIRDLSTTVEGDPFLVSAQKYNCYDLLRKALLTCDTRILDNTQQGLDDIEYPITVSPAVASRLRGTTVYETIFEQKNLWEVLLQIGYYLHAVPYLEFATDGTDRLVLDFRQLGNTRQKADTSNKKTVFNSINLAEYFTQFDSYVTNLFSPQNIVDEWVPVKTSDSSYLVSNDTAEIHTSKPIQEIIEFDIAQNNGQARSALNYIFEHSVYSILTPRREVRPSKDCAVYYTLGDNKILGLNYTAPSENNDSLYALKNIVSTLFGVDAEDIRFNDLKIHIRYRAQDSMRVSQVRPDIQKYMKNSAYEKYPHHEQFYGQQDKIVDSERFSANTFGQLIRVGNAVYQRQEQATPGSEKESGDLVMLGADPYYVTACENEFYPDVILQKVTYSKNFNQLSNIVTIPSEPRFYEVSERSQVRREVRLMEFLAITTRAPTASTAPTYLNSSSWRTFIKGLLFRDNAVTMPNFAYTRFKADTRRTHTVPVSKLFPSVETVKSGDNSVTPKSSADHRDVIVPLLHFPMKNAIAFEWDMEDNFKAGDSIDATISGRADTVDKAYYALQAVRYCDVMGRADLFDFKLFYKGSWTLAQTRRLPFAESNDYVPTDGASVAYIPHSLGIGLDKDNREALSFNLQINLLYDDHNFVTFPNLFGDKKSRLKMCLLNREVSMFDEAVGITTQTLLADNVAYSLVDTGANAIEVRITQPSGVNMSQVKAIVLYEEEAPQKFAYIAKNVGAVPDASKLQSWYIHPVYNGR